MKYALIALLLSAFFGNAQTIKTLGFNATNGQVVASTNLTFTNSINLSEDARAATRTNLGGTTVGNAVFTATNAAAAATAIGLGTSSVVTFNRVFASDFTGTLAGNVNLGGGQSISFVSGGNPAATRTNLGLGATWLTNTDAASFRTAIGLGTAATNPSTAFQPASSALTNLAANSGASLTNIPISGVVNLQTSLNTKLATNGSAAGLTNFPTLNQNTTGTASNVTGVVAIANGGTGANSAGGARTNLGLGATNEVQFGILNSGYVGSGWFFVEDTTNGITFETSEVAAITRTNLGIGVGATNTVSFGKIRVPTGNFTIEDPVNNASIITFPTDTDPVVLGDDYWNHPSVRSSLGFSTNLNSFWTSTSAGGARTNLGLGWSALTNTNASTSLLGVDASGQVIADTGTNALTLTKDTTIASSGGSMSISVNDAVISVFSAAAGDNIITLPIDDIPIFSEFYYWNDPSIRSSFGFSTNLNLFWTSTSVAAARTNLGLGATWLTNTNVTNFRSAIGLGTASSPTFNEVFAGGGLTRTILKGSSIDIQSFFPSYSNTIISFPNSNSAVIQGNLTTSGTLTATGNVTMSGSANTAPNQTAASGSSLMTRDLTDSNPLWSLNSVRTMGAFSFGNSGTGSGASESYVRGGADVRSGTNANGYGRATIYRGINANVGFTGSGINFSQNISVAVVLGMNEMTTNSVYRLVVGGNGGVPAPADSNALTVRGFGVEFARGSSNWPSPNAKARLFAHNGTNYTNSAWTSDFVGYFARQVHAIVTSDGTGNVYLYLTNSPSDGSAPSRPPTTPTLSISGGPTNTSGGGSFVDLVTVNNSTNAPSANAVMIFYNGVLQVK